MAFEADCGSSTVLYALRVASATRFRVPGGFWATSPPRQRRADRGLRVEGSSRGRTSKLKTKNSKLTVRWPGGN